MFCSLCGSSPKATWVESQGHSPNWNPHCHWSTSQRQIPAPNLPTNFAVWLQHKLPMPPILRQCKEKQVPTGLVTSPIKRLESLLFVGKQQRGAGLITFLPGIWLRKGWAVWERKVNRHQELSPRRAEPFESWIGCLAAEWASWLRQCSSRGCGPTLCRKYRKVTNELGRGWSREACSFAVTLKLSCDAEILEREQHKMSLLSIYSFKHFFFLLW